MSDNNSNDDDGDGAAPWLPFANLLTIIERSPCGIGCDVVVGRLSVKFYDVVDEFMAGCGCVYVDRSSCHFRKVLSCQQEC